MKINPFYFSIILSALLFSCKEKPKYFAAKAVVVDRKFRHWGKGYFKVDVYYRYFNGKDSITAYSTLPGMVSIAATSEYHDGDSLRIGYNPSDSSDTFIIESVFKRPNKVIQYDTIRVRAR